MPRRRTASLPSARRAIDPPRKTGWQVSSSVADAVRRAVEEGAAPSQNAFVERALVRELMEVRRRRVYEAYDEAARDPEFRKDMEETSEAFDSTAGDGLAEE